MLEAREHAVARKAHPAPAEPDARRGRARRPGGPGRRHDDSRWPRFARRPVAALAEAARQDDLHDTAGLGRNVGDVRAHRVEIRCRETEGAGAVDQALEVPVEKARATGHDRKGLEQSVTVEQAAVQRVDGGAGAAIDEDARHCALPSARNSPLAFARVSSSSRSGTESATMPAPARSSTSPS